MQAFFKRFDNSSTGLQLQYECTLKMKDGTEDCDTKIDAFRILHECFLSHTEQMSCELLALRTDEEREVDDLEDEIAELEEEVLLLTRVSGGCNSNGHPFPGPSRESLEFYELFVKEHADFVARMSVLQEALQALLLRARIESSDDHALVMWCCVKNKGMWAIKEQELNAGWEALKRRASDIGVSLRVPLMEDALSLFNNVLSLGNRTVDHVVNIAVEQERQARRIAQLEEQQRTLVLWCRQQRANLDVLSNPDHIQEFCASLLRHYEVMSENYQILLETAKPFLDNEAVQEKLLEANEAWVHLQVEALERLQHTLVEVHESTVLEEHVVEHGSFCLQIGPFVDELKKTLSSVLDSASLLRQRCVDLIGECESLQQLLPEHEELCKSLFQFADHMRLMREAYNCYRAAALSRVTCLASSADVLAAVARRKDEFESCVEELKAWITEKAKNESWRQICERVRDIKVLLEREERFIEQEQSKDDMRNRKTATV